MNACFHPSPGPQSVCVGSHLKNLKVFSPFSEPGDAYFLGSPAKCLRTFEAGSGGIFFAKSPMRRTVSADNKPSVKKRQRSPTGRHRRRVPVYSQKSAMHGCCLHVLSARRREVRRESIPNSLTAKEFFYASSFA
jgi:hypothetical protein